MALTARASKCNAVADQDGGSDKRTELIQWDDLDQEQQTGLLVEFGHYLDTLPPTCSMQTKNERFTAWLADRNIIYQGS